MSNRSEDPDYPSIAEELSAEAAEQALLPEGDEVERPSISQLAIPSILGNLSFTIVGMVQTKFIGELGAQALAAVGAGQRVFLSLIHISEPTRLRLKSRMPSCA